MNSTKSAVYRTFLDTNASEPLVQSHIWLEKPLFKAILKRQQCFFWLNPAFMSILLQGKHAKICSQREILSKPQENFPKQLRFERIMLNYLVDNPGDFVGAFQSLPLKLQALFVQAHQSYLFNRFLSERVKHGLPLE